MDLAFFDARERTTFSDELYAVMGRALAVATHYEANLRVLMVALDVKHRRLLLIEAHRLEEETQKLWKRRLNSNVQQLVSLVRKPTGEQELETDEAETRAWLADFLSEKLDNAREARNRIAHEAAIGIEDRAEDDKYRRDFIEMIDEQVRCVAEADFHVAGVIECLNGVNIVPSPDEYIEEVANWVCDVDC